MKECFLLTLGAVICWGEWAFLPKLASQRIDSTSLLVYQGLGGGVIAVFVFLQMGNRIETDPKAIILAIVAGMFDSLSIFLCQSNCRGANLSDCHSISPLSLNDYC